MSNHTNRLINEKSPYLLQHAHNPVDWYPWGEEAFKKARQEDKPVFLSIGYSTCHWCHVMAEESFENQRIAELLNRHFVSIKVDREERPDIDSVYMRIVMALTGSGGWPLSVFLTPEAKPIFGGTYFPLQGEGELPSFAEVLHVISQTWQDKKQDLVSSADQVTTLLQQSTEKQPAMHIFLNTKLFKHAFKELAELFDPEYGGFSAAPKFPTPHQLFFLLRYYQAGLDEAANNKQHKAAAGRNVASWTDGSSGTAAGKPGEAQTESWQPALAMVEKTLQHMLRGGVYDQLGGGFHRYATDRAWLVPHFEKMLYDQVLISRALLEAYQVTKDASYARGAQETLDFVLRDLTGGEGAFYCALDADSPLPAEPDRKSEGAYYLWTLAEVRAVLDSRTADVFSYCFGLSEEGNTGEPGQNVLSVKHTSEEAARYFGLDAEEIKGLVSQAKAGLTAARARRPAPACDDKVLTDWNGLAIGTMAFASRVLKQVSSGARYLAAAEKAVQFFLNNMFDSEERLLHRYRAGEAGIKGLLDDYAFFTYGLLELYEVTLNSLYLEKAFRLMERTLTLFWDEKSGGFFLTARGDEELLLTVKDTFDGALPAGNSLAFYNLLRLGRLAVNKEWLAKGEALFKRLAGTIDQTPSAYTQFLSALYFILGDIREIVIAQGRDKEKTELILDTIFHHFLPFKVLVMRPWESEDLATLTALIPALAVQIPAREQTTVYICKNYTCEVPLTGASTYGADLESRLE